MAFSSSQEIILVWWLKDFWWELEALGGFEAVLWFVHWCNPQEAHPWGQRPPGLWHLRWCFSPIIGMIQWINSQLVSQAENPAAFRWMWELGGGVEAGKWCFKAKLKSVPGQMVNCAAQFICLMQIMPRLPVAPGEPAPCLFLLKADFFFFSGNILQLPHESPFCGPRGGWFAHRTNSGSRGEVLGWGQAAKFARFSLSCSWLQSWGGA